jgi:hypothetical protein
MNAHTQVGPCENFHRLLENKERRAEKHILAATAAFVVPEIWRVHMSLVVNNLQ